jgi:hypothetical protein
VIRLLPVLLAAAVLLAAGCGGDDGGGSASGGGETEQAERDSGGGGDSGEDSSGDSSGSGGGSNGGAGGGSSDEDAVRQTMLDYANALAAGDAAAACETLSDRAKRELAQVYEGSGDCEATFGRFLPSLPKGEAEKARNLEASQLDVEVSGDTATVTGPGFERPAPMVEVGGDWKIASFASR